MTLSGLQYALSRNGTALEFPPGKRQMPLTLWGNYSLPQLARAMERQLDCQAIQTRSKIDLRFNKTHTFQLLVPDYGNLPTTKTPGVTATQIGRQMLLTGPDHLLPTLHHILKHIYNKPPQIRVTCYIIDDNRATNIDFTAGPATNEIQFSQLSQLWQGITATINLLDQQSAIKTKFETICQDAQPLTFSDTDQKEVQEYTSLPNAQTASQSSLLNSSLTARTAGLSVTLKCIYTQAYWTVTGTVTDSNFAGTSALADLLSRNITFTASMSANELFRLATMDQNSKDNEIGIPNTNGQFNDDTTGAKWSLWIRIQPLYPTERRKNQ